MKFINFYISFFAGIRLAVSGIFEFSKDWPGQVYPIIFVSLINVLTLFVFDVEGTIFSPLASITIWILIGFQWMSLRKSIAKRHKDRIADDKKRLASFFGHGASPHQFGILGLLFLKPFKETWYNPKGWYYKLKGITRLSLYVWGDTDNIGSYTKIPVNREVLFHLSLMGCIDQDNPDFTKKGLDYIKANS